MTIPNGPRQVTTEINEKGYTRVSNKILLDARLTPADAGVYAKIVRVASVPGLPQTRSWEQLAALAGIPERTFTRYRQKFCELGLFRLRKGGRLLVVTDCFYEDEEEIEVKEFELIYEEATEELQEPEPEKTIIKELEEQPKRKKQMATEDRWTLIRSAWERYKDDSWPRFNKNAGTKIAIEVVMKQLKIPHDDYDGYMGAVIEGVKASDWWSDKPKTIGSIFGSKGDLSDNQIHARALLYRSGAGIYEAMPKGSRFDFENDLLVLNLFNHAKTDAWKGTRLELLPDFKKVLRIKVEVFDEMVIDLAKYAWRHYLYRDSGVEQKRGNMIDPADVSDMTYPKTQPGGAALFTDFPEAYEPGTVHLFYCNNRDYPVAWTGQEFKQWHEGQFSEQYTIHKLEIK
jgi:hypothetical protein